MNCEAKKQKWYYDRTTSTVQLVQGDVVLMKSNAYQGTGGVRLNTWLSGKLQMMYPCMK